MEVVRLFTWLDRTAAQIWLGFVKFPAWYIVSAAGTLAFLLTALLFMTYVSSHDPTLGELANRSQPAAHATREKLEEAGDWAAQDKWRVAHMFVPHRPSKHLPSGRLKTPVVDDPVYASTAQPSMRGRQMPYGSITLPETEVQLDLMAPRIAEQPKRLVYGQLVREAGSDFRRVRPVANYRTRDSRLLVQAEWAVGSDCDSEIVRHPKRRIIPVPDPQWDELPVPEDDRHPDLSFTMLMLREFLPATDQFPARSRLVSVSAKSEFPASLASTRANPFGDESHWHRTAIGRSVPERRDESYADRVGIDEDLPPIEELEPKLNSIPSFAEIALRLELHTPDSTSVGRVNKSSLVLRNEGLREIPLIMVRESLAGLETVTDAIPAARVAQFENSLDRQVHRLEPGKKERLELVWRPDSEGKRTHSALVSVKASVAATTEIVPAVGEQPMPSVAPEPLEQDPPLEPLPFREPDPIPEPHPGLSMDVQNQPRAMVDEMVEIAITVRNTGDVPLHNVQVVVELPEHLKHRRGAEVEYAIAELPVRGSERAVLRVVAHSSGQAVCKLHVTAAEPAEAKSRAVVEVQTRPARHQPKIAKTAPAAKQPTPAPTPPRNCCCQPVASFGPWFEP